MRLKQIAYFLRTCDTLNFSRAAAQCHVSQPSLSNAILKLEDELGAKLFKRNSGTVELTSFGQTMRIHLSRIEEAERAALATAFEIAHAEAETINIGFMCTLNPNSLLTAISTYTSCDNSAVELLIHDITHSNWPDLLVSGAIDCVIAAHTKPLSERFTVKSLGKEQMVVGVPAEHPLSEYREINLEQMQNHGYVDRLRCEFREHFFQKMSHLKLPVNVILRTEREDLVRDAITAGVGISILPKSVAVDSSLNYCELSDLYVERQISFVSPKNSHLGPSIDKLVDLLLVAYGNGNDNID